MLIAFIALAISSVSPPENWLPNQDASPLGPPITRFECAAKGPFHPEYGERGNRAVVAADGSALVLQCADGIVLGYSASTGNKNLGEQTLFSAAQTQALIPRLPCQWDFSYKSPLPADCNIIDHVGDTYLTDESGGAVVRARSQKRSWRARPPETPRFLDLGILWPRDGVPREVVVGNDSDEPAVIEAYPLGDGPPRTIARIPVKHLVVENGESSPQGIKYSSSENLIVVPMGGVFRIAQDVGILRAYSPLGELRWTLKKRLSREDGALITGDVSRLSVLANGRYGAIGLQYQTGTTWIIDLRSGAVADVLPGDLIAASASGSRLLIRTSPQEVVLVDWVPRQ